MNSEAWQQGIDLQRLKQIKHLFSRYKPYSFGRFSIPNEAEIAQMIVDNQAYELFADDGSLIAFINGKPCSRQSHLRKDFAGTQFFAYKNDFVIKHLTFVDNLPDQIVSSLFDKIGSKSIWIETHTEDKAKIDQLQRLNFKIVGTKIAASSEMKTIMLRSSFYQTRVPNKINIAELATLDCLAQTFVPDGIIRDIITELNNYNAHCSSQMWANHYSSYNQRKSWSAVTLKGYKDDPSYIIKPSEMSLKWKQENQEMLDAAVQETSAAQWFPTVNKIIDLIGCETQRVRFMRVRAQDGGLSRHADITDKEAGATIGKVARLHLPIQTNAECMFTAWQANGEQITKHLPVASLWYLDTRKPHAVSNNGGAQDRIHLVIDAIVNNDLQDWIYGKAARVL